MPTNEPVTREGSKVTIETGSTAEAKRLAAQAKMKAMRDEQGFFERWINKTVDGLDRSSDALGRFDMSAVAWAFFVVAVTVSFMAWIRFLPFEVAGVTWLSGLIGVGLCAGMKWGAARVAGQEIKREAEMERLGSDYEPDKDKFKKARDAFLTFTLCLWLADGVGASAFFAAVTVDSEVGYTDAVQRIEELRSEARDIEREAEAMPRSPRALEDLQFELEKELNAIPRNTQDVATDFPVRDAIGWGADLEPDEGWCMPGSQYQYYVTTYCPDVVDAFGAYKQKLAYEKRRDEAGQKLAEAAHLDATKPRPSSGVALGSMLSGWLTVLPGVVLVMMLTGLMGITAYMAKRHPKGA